MKIIITSVCWPVLRHRSFILTLPQKKGTARDGNLYNRRAIGPFTPSLPVSSEKVQITRPRWDRSLLIPYATSMCSPESKNQPFDWAYGELDVSKPKKGKDASSRSAKTAATPIWYSDPQPSSHRTCKQSFLTPV